MTIHDPRRVRLNVADGTAHCAIHGLLDEPDLRMTLRRAGMSRANVDTALASRILTWPFVATFIRLMEFVMDKATRPKCVTLS